MSGVTQQQLEAAIRERLSAQHVEILDQSGGCGQSYEVTVVSPLFEGKNKLARHRLVNKALETEIAQIHAFTQVSRRGRYGCLKGFVFRVLMVERIYAPGMGKSKLVNVN